MPKRLPIKLQTEPIIEAICEMRFVSTASAALLPGILFAQMTKPRVQPAGAAGVPEAVRKQNAQFFQYQPLLRVEDDNYRIAAGDQVVTIACRLPYPGWATFGRFAEQILGRVIDSGIVSIVERIAVKFVNLVEPMGGLKSHQMIDWHLKIGPFDKIESKSTINFELVHGDLITLTALAGDATAVIDGGVTRTGSIIDVDTILNVNSDDLAGIRVELPANLNRIRRQNKEVFFDCLTNHAIDLLRPEYE